MRWIDRQGRLLGRLNLIDACVAAIVAVILIPLALFGYGVVRLAEPEIRTVTPDTVKKGTLSRIEISGKHFEKGSTVEMGPFNLRAEVVDSRKIIAKVPPMIPVGTYAISVRNPKGVKGLKAGWLTVKRPEISKVVSARSKKIKSEKRIEREKGAESVIAEPPPKASIRSSNLSESRPVWATFIASFEVKTKEAFKVVEEAVGQDYPPGSGQVVKILSKKRHGPFWRMGFGSRRLIIAQIALHALMYVDSVETRDQATTLFSRDGQWLQAGTKVTFQIRGQEFIARVLTEPVGVSHSRLRVWSSRHK